MADYVTNGNMLNKAIREKDTVLEEYMKNKFKDWCTDHKESVYSNSALRYWKGLRYTDDV